VVADLAMRGLATLGELFEVTSDATSGSSGGRAGAVAYVGRGGSPRSVPGARQRESQHRDGGPFRPLGLTVVHVVADSLSYTATDRLVPGRARA